MRDLEELKERVRAFVRERDWERFHSPKNLSMALSVEAAELVELFQWLTEEESAALDAERKLRVADRLEDEAHGPDGDADPDQGDPLDVADGGGLERPADEPECRALEHEDLAHRCREPGGAVGVGGVGREQLGVARVLAVAAGAVPDVPREAAAPDRDQPQHQPRQPAVAEQGADQRGRGEAQSPGDVDDRDAVHLPGIYVHRIVHVPEHENAFEYRTVRPRP